MSNLNGVDLGFCSLVDCHGLLFLAATSSNRIKAAALDQMQRGCLRVSSKAIQEFSKFYPKEAAKFPVPKNAIIPYKKPQEIAAG